MAEDENREITPVDEGPGTVYANYLAMEDLLDKMKLLKYDQNFLKKSSSYKPLSRHYFAVQTNSGEQFFMFTSVCAWLIQRTGNAKFEPPQENVAVDFPPNRLKTGAGEQCLYVLNSLADAALLRGQFNFQRADAPKEDAEDAAVGADESELTADQFDEHEDEEPEMAEDDDDETYMDLEGLKNLSQMKAFATEEKKEILYSDTNANEWKLEVERVMPSLKIVVRPDAKDWRSHLEQMQQYRNGIDETLKQAQTQLERLANDIGKSMEKITSRERYLNTQLESLLSQFRTAQDRLAEVKEKYKEASGGVTQRTWLLQQITDDLEQIKQEMEDRGSSLTDGAPLVKIKQALMKLQTELIGMDVQIGVVEQSLLQAQLRDRTYLHHDMHALGVSGDDFAY